MLVRLVSRLTCALVIAGCGGGDGGDEGSATAASTSGSGDAPTGGGGSADVCAAACAKFAECGSEDPSCEDDCVAGIEFIAMNNPDTPCGAYEAGRQNCLAQLTCAELDAYLTGPNDPMRPCESFSDHEGECAIE